MVPANQRLKSDDPARDDVHQTRHVPILAASGDTHLAGAADAVLEKPYDDHSLVTIVNSLLEKGREVR